MTKWNDPDTAPKDRDFIAQLKNGYITRARMIGHHFSADSSGPKSSLGVDPSLECWMELPKPRKAKGKSQPKGYTPEFDAIWDQYPARRNSSKWDAFRAWRALTDDERKKVSEVLPIASRELSQRDEKYIPHLSSWLNGKRFETVVMPTRQAPAAPAAQTNWRRALSIFQSTSNWNIELGPPPGQPECRVPAEILREYGL